MLAPVGDASPSSATPTMVASMTCCVRSASVIAMETVWPMAASAVVQAQRLDERDGQHELQLGGAVVGLAPRDERNRLPGDEAADADDVLACRRPRWMKSGEIDPRRLHVEHAVDAGERVEVESA